MTTGVILASWAVLVVTAPVGAITIWRALEKYILERRDRAVAKCLASVYQEILSDNFPGVCIMSRGHGDGLQITVYMVPDGRAGEFMEFLLDKMGDLLRARGLENKRE